MKKNRLKILAGLSLILSFIFSLVLSPELKLDWGSRLDLTHYSLHPKAKKNIIATYIEQGEFVRFDENGLKKEQLYLQSAYQFKTNPVTQIIQPKLIQYKQDKFISLSAKQADATHLGLKGKLQHIIFNQDVCITSAPFILNTSTLSYHPDKHLAKTDALITISGEQLQIQAKGMILHLPTGKMDLLNQVTSQYEYEYKAI